MRVSKKLVEFIPVMICVLLEPSLSGRPFKMARPDGSCIAALSSTVIIMVSFIGSWMEVMSYLINEAGRDLVLSTRIEK